MISSGKLRKSHSEVWLVLMMSPWLYSAIDISRNTLLTEAWRKYVLYLSLKFDFSRRHFWESALLFWFIHRYANDLLSPLFMPAGTPIPLILYVSFIYRHIKKHITFSMGEGIASVWRLYWGRISNIYFYLSAFQQNTNWIWVKL